MDNNQTQTLQSPEYLRVLYLFPPSSKLANFMNYEIFEFRKRINKHFINFSQLKPFQFKTIKWPLWLDIQLLICSLEDLEFPVNHFQEPYGILK